MKRLLYGLNAANVEQTRLPSMREKVLERRRVPIEAVANALENRPQDDSRAAAEVTRSEVVLFAPTDELAATAPETNVTQLFPQMDPVDAARQAVDDVWAA